VHELAKRLTNHFNVVAVVPSAPGALAHEVLNGVELFRYRYAPRCLETLVNNGGIVTNLRRDRWKSLLVPTFILMQFWQAWRITRRYRVLAIHAHWLIPQGAIARLLQVATREHIPYVVTSHGADLFALRGRAMNALKRWVIQHASVSTVVSEAMLENLESIGANLDAVRILPMGVDMAELFTPGEPELRSKSEILFVGRLVEKKGLSYLLDAMPKILTKVPNARLTIAGFGPEEAALQQQIERLNLRRWVTFIGAVSQEELPQIYRRAAVFVAPFVQTASGDQDGLGLVCIEALSCGCPIVVSDLSVTRDILQDGDGCLRAIPGDTASLAEKVIKILLNQSAHLLGAERRRQKIFNRFDWSIVSEGYANIFQEYVKQRYESRSR
jgi:glycosyltransferase involved in cell wall biosynthesis